MDGFCGFAGSIWPLPVKATEEKIGQIIALIETDHENKEVGGVGFCTSFKSVVVFSLLPPK